ncbi:MAG TPA: crossover junction endodeoxyribonuclease RuvC [Dongiaceae bacterium]|jgi:crossover junction endodeoxyribonuclease RuvC
MRLLGLDPGLRHTGWGIIDVEGSHLRYVADGAIHPKADLGLPERLVHLHHALAKVIADHRPAEAAVEETFVSQNAASTLKLGMARGVVVLVPALASLPVSEYPANLIKKSVVGVGHATKDQVQMMVRRLLPGCRLDSEDSADALAVAICHAHHAGTARRIAAAAVGGLR